MLAGYWEILIESSLKCLAFSTKKTTREENAYKIKLNRTKEYMKCYEKQILYQISTVLIPIRGIKEIARMSRKV